MKKNRTYDAKTKRKAKRIFSAWRDHPSFDISVFAREYAKGKYYGAIMYAEVLFEDTYENFDKCLAEGLIIADTKLWKVLA